MAPEPYVKKNPGDILRSGDWNELQSMTRGEIQSHQHKGGEDGKPIPREGIQPAAIDGSRIDPAAEVTVKTLTATGNLTVKGDLTVNGKEILADVADLLAAVKGLQADRVKRGGDTITGPLIAQKDLAVGGVLAVSGGIRVDGGTGGSTAAHIETDGAFYRFDGQVYLTVDDNLYIRSKNGSIRMNLDAANGVLKTAGIQTLDGTRVLQSGGGSLQVGAFTDAEADEWPRVVWYRDSAKSWDEGIIKHGPRGFFNRCGYGVHMHEKRDWGIWSTNWTHLFGVEGGTGNTTVRGALACAGVKVDASRTDHLEVDGSFYRYQGQAYITIDDNLYIRRQGGDIKMHFDVANGIFKTDVLKLGEKFRLSGVGDLYANDLWLRMCNANNTGYYGGFAADDLWTNRGVLAGSDVRLKEDIRPLRESLKKLSLVNGVTFKWRNAEKDRTEIGVLAQDVETVLPELVRTGPDGVKGVNYGGLVAVLVEALKDQQAQIEALRASLG